MQTIAVRELENTGYIFIRITPIGKDDEMPTLNAIIDAFPGVAILGGVMKNEADTIEIVSAVSPFPVHVSEFNIARDKLYAAFKPYLPEGAYCYTPYGYATRGVVGDVSSIIWRNKPDAEGI